MWLFQQRSLGIHQKVILVNTYVTSRLWFMASVLSIPNSSVAKITSRIGNFIWARYPCRIPIEQLALPVSKGGLNLHLPSQKCKALLLNRFLRCLEYTPFASSFLDQFQNPPNVSGIPALYPCLKLIARELPYLPENITRNPSSPAVLDTFRNTMQTPKVVAENPNVQWSRIWRNVRSRALASAEKSTYYLIVNGKIPHAALFYRQNRVDTPMCIHCTTVEEDLEHKFSTCVRVRHLWSYLRPKLEAVLNRRVNYKMLSFPELKNTDSISRNKALKMFIVYVNFVLDVKSSFTVEALDFVLSCCCP